MVFLVVSPFLVPLGWAAVFAILFYPVHARIRAEGWRPSTAAGITTLAAAVVLIAPMVSIVTTFAQEAIQAAGNLQGVFSGGESSRVDSIIAFLESRLPSVLQVDIRGVANDVFRAVGAFLVAESGALARSLAGFIVDLGIALFAMFFMLRDADAIMRTIRRLLPLSASEREALIVRTRELISIGVVSSLIVAAVQGLLGGITYLLLGFNSPLFWGVMIAFCCLLPFGAWVVWLPTAIVLAINGDMTRALILAGVGLGIVSGSDNILRPLLLSGSAKMNGLVILISLLGGISVFGLLGLVLGPIVVVTALALLETYVSSPRRSDQIELTEE
jgi:predicted PurR-regulated permease PerM